MHILISMPIFFQGVFRKLRLIIYLINFHANQQAGVVQTTTYTFLHVSAADQTIQSDKK